MNGRVDEMLARRVQLMADNPQITQAAELAPLMGDLEQEYWAWCLERYLIEAEHQPYAVALAFASRLGHPITHSTLRSWTRRGYVTKYADGYDLNQIEDVVRRAKGMPSKKDSAAA